MGTPEINATSFPDCVARTPTCQSCLQPGDFNALVCIRYRSGEVRRHNRPTEKRYRVVKSEHGLVVLNVMPVQELIYLLQLSQNQHRNIEVCIKSFHTCLVSVRSIVTHVKPSIKGAGSLGTSSGLIILIGPSSLCVFSSVIHVHSASSVP